MPDMPPSPDLGTALYILNQSMLQLTNRIDKLGEIYATKQSVESLQKDFDEQREDRKSWVRSSVIVFLTGIASIAATFFEALVIKK